MCHSAPVKRIAALVAAACLALLAGCTQGAGSTPPPSPTASTPASATPTTSAAPAATPTPTATPSPLPAPSVTPAAWPPAVGEEEVMRAGGTYWAVWLQTAGASDELDPGLEQELEALGYGTAGTPVGCFAAVDEGAGLDVSPDAWGHPLYFGSRSDADLFTELWNRPVAGIVEGDLACDWG